MSGPSVSILMGSFNPTNPHVLKEAVDSVVAQTWTDWELVLCDDGSCETCAAYLRQTAQMDPRIRYIRSEENRGLAHALNLCFQEAKGTWIARMDDDDIAEPQRLERQVRFLETHSEYAWVGTQAVLFDGSGAWGKTVRPEVPVASDYLRYSPFIHPSVMFRREALERMGGYKVSPYTRRCEDYELFMRMAAAGLQGYNLPDILFRYRESRGVLTKRRFGSCLGEMIIRFSGFRKMHVLSIRTLPYAVKPMAVWAMACCPGFAQKFRRTHSAGILPFSTPAAKD